MKAKGWGRIINFASLQTGRAFPNGIAYGATKGGVGQLTRAMAEAWSKDGITANAIAPGEIETDILSPGTDKIVEKLPLRRLGKPEEVARTIYYLCTPESSYVSGVEIEINGGQHV